MASALLTDQGNVYLGVCIDTNCGMGFCAEHTAVANMVTNGESRVLTIVAVNWDGRMLAPCGRCREFIYQVDSANVSTRVLLNGDRESTIELLLPDHWAAEL